MLARYCARSRRFDFVLSFRYWSVAPALDACGPELHGFREVVGRPTGYRR